MAYKLKIFTMCSFIGKKKKPSSDLNNIQQTLSLGLVRAATCAETDLKLTTLTSVAAAAKSLQSCLCDTSVVSLCVTPETAAHQAPPSLGFSRQEHWSGLPLPSPPLPLNNRNTAGFFCPFYLHLGSMQTSDHSFYNN